MITRENVVKIRFSLGGKYYAGYERKGKRIYN